MKERWYPFPQKLEADASRQRSADALFTVKSCGLCSSSLHKRKWAVFQLRQKNTGTAEEETYDRWLAEGGTFYQSELGDEVAHALYQESHEIGRKLRQVLGEQVYITLCEAIR